MPKATAHTRFQYFLKLESSYRLTAIAARISNNRYCWELTYYKITLLLLVLL